MTKLLKTRPLPCMASLGLLLLRILVGVAFLHHGWGKLHNPFGWMGADAAIPGVLQGAAALAEVGGGLALIVGLFTPLAALLLGIVMATAVYMHAYVWGDPFVASAPEQNSYEMALVYLAIALFILMTGPGSLSLDRLLFGDKCCGETVK